jgi:ABC-type Fe3+/spermidine/putrescine transport system ATPase subunit
VIVQEASKDRAETATAAVVELDGVTKRFGEVAALENVTLVIPAGSFFALLGPSGCGKTTLLRILAGLETLDAGRVLLDGQDITRVPPELRPCNIVFQRYALFPHLTVRENIAFGLTTRRRRLPKSTIAAEVRKMLELVGLPELGERMPSQLSGGQAQRVAVARALIRQPELLLLDEPLSALDRNVRHALRGELLRIHRELGTTFVIVTHDQDEALSMAQHVALLNEGRVEQVADPETLYRNPATLFAARFIGSGTFVQGRVVARRDKHVEVNVDGFTLETIDSGIGSATDVQVLFRPEDLTIATGECTQVTGEVETCAFFGSDYELAVRTPIGTLRVRTPTPLAPGETLGLSWREKAGLVFPTDADSTTSEE